MRKYIIFFFIVFMNEILVAQWLLVFEDNFNGNRLDKKYWYNYRWWGNYDENAYIDSGNVKVENGYLVLQLERDFTYYPPYNTTAAYACSKIFFRYGIIEAKIKIPDVRGCWSAFWLYGSEIHGDEIDIFEQYWLSNPHKVNLKSTIHHSGEDVSNSNKFDRDFINNKWHTYTLTWDDINEEKAKIKIHIDGEKVAEFRETGNNELHKYPLGTKKINYPTHSQRIIFDIVPHDNFTVNTTHQMLIDYVKVWQKQDCENDITLCNYDPNFDNNIYTGNTIQTGDNCNIVLGKDSFLYLYATKEVHLKSGFSVKNGGNFIAKIIPCSSNKINNIEDDNLLEEKKLNSENEKYEKKFKVYTIYPNPFYNQITVEIYYIQEYNNSSLEIIDIYGNSLIKELLKNYKTTIDLNKLNSGIYFIKLNINDYQFYEKIIKI